MTRSTLAIHLSNLSAHRNLHEDTLKNAIPDWLTNISPAKLAALRNMQPDIPEWYKTASPQEHDTLKKLVSAAWTAQNQVDQAMADLKSPESFGAPLLQQLLKQRFAIELDVKTTYVRLYIPQTIPWFPIRTGGARVWTVSLLEAALHNFEAGEIYEVQSGFTTKPTSTGQLENLPAINARMTVAQFTALCRELDIGGQYQRYLEQHFNFKNLVPAAQLQIKIEQSQAADLNVALQMARMKKDLLDDQSYGRLWRLLNAPDRASSGPALRSYDLTIMSSPLTGIVLFAESFDTPHAVSVIAYIPDDPIAPLKQYRTFIDFINALGNNLRSAEYQTFFSRFVNHEERGYFFADLKNRLSRITWHPYVHGDPRPSWRETPIDNPRLQFDATNIRGNLFGHLYQRKLSKVFNDARTLAVSTASVDQKARWERWDIVQKIASALLQIAALIAAPFVPPIGLLMLGYSAYQMLDEAFEWVIDWAEGEVAEAFGHLLSFVEQGLQLGLFIAGAPLATGALRTLLPTDTVQFFDQLKPVTLPNGETRLWKPDLAPYAHDLQLSKNSSPNAQGLHAYNGKNALLLLEKPFVIQTDPVTQLDYLQHPSRPNAYRPRVMTNGKGAWLTELDNPLSWDSTTLMKRQGPQTLGLSDEQLANIRHISATDEGALRKMHLNQHQPPPLLTDTLERFKIDQALQDFIDQMHSDDPAIYARADAQTQLHLITSQGLWPKTKTLRILDAQGKTLWELAGEKNARVVQIHEAQLKNGDLLKTLLETLDEPQQKILVGEAFGDSFTNLKNRTFKLRKNLSRLAQSHRRELFNSRYQRLNTPTASRQQVVIDNTPGLPLSAADTLLDIANSHELREIDQGTVPERLNQLAQALQDEAKINRAYEGLYLNSTGNLDTHRLALHSLEQLPGWAKKLRIEIRNPPPASTLIDAIGKPKARIKRILVRSTEGRYTPQDSHGSLSPETDLYTAILQALPDAERDALGLRIGQGSALKQALRTHALERKPLRTLISAQPARKPADTREHLRLLGMDSYPPAPAIPTVEPNPPATSRAVARELFPAHTDEQIDDLIQELESRPGGAWPLLTALRQEYRQLDIDLSTWENSTPQRYPDTELSMSVQEYKDARQNRRLCRLEIMRCWRQETEVDRYFEPPIQNGHKLRLHPSLYGELPVLRKNFEHVSYLEFKDEQMAMDVDGFLRKFPSLRYLRISKAQLSHLPPAVSTLPRLNTLILSDCNITLTPENLSTLTSMHKLRTLDLFNNPLGLTPSVENMIDIQFLDLSSTGISQLPAGILSRPQLELANLSDNQITQLPPEFFELPADTTKTFDLSGNPLSRPTLEQVKTYFQRTGRYWSINAPDADARQVNKLFPDFSENEVSRLIFGLPGNLEMGTIELARLELEYSELSSKLDTWVRHAAAPEEQTRRQAFKQELQTCWRREGALDASNPQAIPTYTLESSQPFNGEFPPLNSTFHHVSTLRLHGAETPFPLQSSLFFRGFPTLNQLSVERYVMGDIPNSIFDMQQLSSLRLQHCAITLSTESAASLSTMNSLEQLDLSHNPLGRLPDVGALPRLSNINLEETGLREIPAGLLTHIKRKSVNLSNNLITEIPDAAFTLPAAITDAFDLSRNPLSRSALMQIKDYCQSTANFFKVHAPALIRDRISALYPAFNEEQINRFFFELPGDLDAVEPAIERLEAEYEKLCVDLQQWALDVPQRHPILDIPLDEQTRAQDQFNRLTLKTFLEEAWRRETESDDDDDTGFAHKLAFEISILGDLPELSARFDNVFSIELDGEGTTTGIDGLLRCFPKLKNLTISKFSLGDIPSSLFTLPELEALSLIECSIRLTPTSVDGLSGMENLVFLDLSDNLLGIPPNISHMSKLRALYLQDTAITEIPRGMFALPELLTLDLSDNLIEEIPSDILEISPLLGDASDLSGNPWSEQSLSLLRQYYQQSGNDLGVEQARLDTEGNPLTSPSSPGSIDE